MKFGSTASLLNAPMLFDAGADFIEICTNELDRLDAAGKLAEAAAIAEANPGRFPVANGMLPWDAKVVGPDAKDYREYLERNFSRLAKWGVKQIIFGNGGARRIPDDLPREEGLAQYNAMLQYTADIAAKYDMMLAIEPLNYKESNVAISVKEAFELGQKANRPNINAHLDLYHIGQNGECEDVVRPYVKYMQHIHIANPATRKILRKGDFADYAAFFNMLREEGFDGTVSFEGAAPEAPNTWSSFFDFLRTL